MLNLTYSKEKVNYKIQNVDNNLTIKLDTSIIEKQISGEYTHFIKKLMGTH